MSELTLLLLRAITMVCRGHHDLVLENLALRHQLRTLKPRVKRPHFRTRDRMFWVVLASAWRQWRSALVLVHPETVVRWHRTWVRRRWAQRSGRNRAGRPPLDPCRSPEYCRRPRCCCFQHLLTRGSVVAEFTLLLLRAITLACRGHHDVVSRILPCATSCEPCNDA